MKLAVPRETSPGETRVAATPESVKKFKGLGLDVVVETGAGNAANFADADYAAAGASIAPDARTALADADIVLKVRGPQAGDAALMKKGAVLAALLAPHTDKAGIQSLAGQGVSAFAMEFLPRISRAQAMDVLSSQANLAGYKAVIDAAAEFGRAMPMMMTAAGTIAPARVLVLGAGVAGLQAIATARRLGAVVSGYDIRAAVREQIESLGARFVVLDMGDAQVESSTETKGGYAKAMGEEFYRRQREAMANVFAEQNVIVTTAAVPGKKAPILITREMVHRMPPGSVIVDIAAERGGNCELTRPGEIVVEHGVSIHGPVNLPSTIPYHASQMYARNIATFLKYLVKEGKVTLDQTDEIVRETLVTHAGEVVHMRVRELMGLPVLATVS